jgi:hypothetical protein
MRNDSIERSVNDSILTITDYIFQMIERAKRQKDIDMKRIMNQQMNNLKQDSSLLSTEEKIEAEYDLYYALIKEHYPDLFEVKGNPVETFPVDSDKKVFQIFQDKNQFFGVYKEKTKKAHKITSVFSSKEEVLQKTFGTSQFEKFRERSFFLTEDGKAFSLHENKHLCLNLSYPFKNLTIYENIEQARSAVIKEELKSDPKFLKQALYRTLEEHHIPSDLLGKTVTLQSISKDNDGVRLFIEENQRERDIGLPDIVESWMERVKDHPKMKVVFDEIIMDSRSVAEGFLAFYGMEINKEIQTRQHDFEVISNEEGSYIGKLSGNGMVKKVSPYFSEKEAENQLKNLNIHIIQLEKEKARQGEIKVEPSMEFIEISEKN